MFFLLGCTAAMVWPTGLGNFDTNFLTNFATKPLTHSVFSKLIHPFPGKTHWLRGSSNLSSFTLLHIKISRYHCDLLRSKSASHRDMNNVSAFKDIDSRKMRAAESVRSGAIATSATSATSQQQQMSMQQQSREIDLMHDSWLHCLHLHGDHSGCGKSPIDIKTQVPF